MRLAQAHAAIEEKRVVGFRGLLGDGERGGVRELVRRADDERVEGVARIQLVIDGVEIQPRLRTTARAPQAGSGSAQTNSRLQLRACRLPPGRPAEARRRFPSAACGKAARARERPVAVFARSCRVGRNQVAKLCGLTRRSMCWRILSQRFIERISPYCRFPQMWKCCGNHTAQCEKELLVWPRFDRTHAANRAPACDIG